MISGAEVADRLGVAHNIDDLLNDLALHISPLRRARQWLLPVDPSDYEFVGSRLNARLHRRTTGIAEPATRQLY